MNKKPLIILLVIILLAMSFLIWFKKSEDINNNLNNNIPVLEESGESESTESSGGIDINLSGDDPISVEKENSGESILSGETSGSVVEKDPVVVPEPEPEKEPVKEPENEPDKENNIVNSDVESGEVAVETVNPVLVSDDTKLAFKMGATQIVVYYYDGETITKKESYIDYKSEASAQKAAAEYNDGTRNLSDIGDIKSASSQGKYVVMTYNESEYESLTFSKVKMLYGKYEITK